MHLRDLHLPGRSCVSPPGRVVIWRPAVPPPSTCAAPARLATAHPPHRAHTPTERARAPCLRASDQASGRRALAAERLAVRPGHDLFERERWGLGLRGGVGVATATAAASQLARVESRLGGLGGCLGGPLRGV